MRRLDPQALGDHLDAMYRAAWAMCGSREDAEDLVQDTFARVLQRPRLTAATSAGRRNGHTCVIAGRSVGRRTLLALAAADEPV